MGIGNELIKTFAHCFRLLARLNAGIKNGFFVDLISKESEKLLVEYIKFLKIRGDKIRDFHVVQPVILQHRDVVKPNDIVQRWGNVAQYRSKLTSQIRNIFKLLEIIKHLKLTNQITPLLLERELLKLELLLLNYSKPFSTIRAWAGGSLDNQQKNKDLKKPAKPQELGMAHKKIAEFIRSKERVQNIEVFGHFANTTRRTLKRKLSELVKAGAIKRFALGKKVFYAQSIRVQLR